MIAYWSCVPFVLPVSGESIWRQPHSGEQGCPARENTESINPLLIHHIRKDYEELENSSKETTLNKSEKSEDDPTAVEIKTFEHCHDKGDHSIVHLHTFLAPTRQEEGTELGLKISSGDLNAAGVH